MARADLIATFAALDPRARLPWFGPAMSAASSLTARIMETWAHTQDIADALGVTREPTDRLRHVAHIGVGARAFSYAVHGKTPPAAEIRVELTGPDGTRWTWGPPEAENRVTGPALDFCLLVTQRRHRDDLALAIDGPAATEWMAIAQAFAGAAGPPERSPQSGQQSGGEPMTRPVRIANCSGFYGDRLAAAREMLDQGSSPIDVLTGDYLAELTMLILWKARRKDPGLGYATTFLRQMEDVLGTCLERGVKVVANAGGLNPAGLAAKITELSGRLGLHARVAYITGDDLIPVIGDLQAAGHEFANLDTGLPLAKADLPVVTANAYLGGWGITAALQAGADVVICPRVTDASLVTGPAAWWHGWRRDDWDALAGAVAAGHVIECGPQATGGNYSFLDEITDRRYPGFPIAEVAADGSSVITKHDGTGGLVSVGTVTAQLLYEIGDPAYLNPDVVAHFDTIRLEQAGPDRVALTGTRGSPPPDTLKVALNMLGGYRNTTTMVLTGLDIEQKAEHAVTLLTGLLGGTEQFDEFDVRLLRFDHPDAPTNEQATAHLRVTVKDQDERKVGRAFSNAAMELALAGYAGFHTTSPPTAASAFGVYWPTLIPGDLVTQTVHLPDGRTQVVRHHERAPPASARVPGRIRPRPSLRPRPGPVRPGRRAARPRPRRRPDREHPARAAVRRAFRRQGRRRQRGPVGHQPSRVRLAARLPDGGPAGRAAHRGGRPADRPLRAAEPAGPQLRHPRPARPRRVRHHPPRRPGQGPRRVPALAPRPGPRRPAVKQQPVVALRPSTCRAGAVRQARAVPRLPGQAHRSHLTL